MFNTSIASSGRGQPVGRALQVTGSIAQAETYPLTGHHHIELNPVRIDTVDDPGQQAAK
jgi:hypothetical protein